MKNIKNVLKIKSGRRRLSMEARAVSEGGDWSYLGTTRSDLNHNAVELSSFRRLEVWKREIRTVDRCDGG